MQFATLLVIIKDNKDWRDMQYGWQMRSAYKTVVVQPKDSAADTNTPIVLK